MNAFPQSIHGALARTRKGFGLLEVILVFALVIGAGAVTFFVAQSVSRSAAVDHDRNMATTIAANIFSVYQRDWDDTNGKQVLAAWDVNSQQFAGGFCSSGDNHSGLNCRSALSGEPVDVSEYAVGTTGEAIGVDFQDLTIDQCVSLLAGGQGTIGAQAIGNSPTYGTTVSSEVDAISFCKAAASGSNVRVELWFTPSGPFPNLSTTTPTSGGLPPLPPGGPPNFR
jgi:type II secretory pathway pseudopilin PulG